MGGQGSGLLGQEGENRDRADQGQADEEQEREDRLQGEVSGGQEALRVRDRSLERSRAGCQEGSGHQGLRRHRRQVGTGKGSARQGKVVVQGLSSTFIPVSAVVRTLPSWSCMGKGVGA